jgi:hypothetical protein
MSINDAKIWGNRALVKRNTYCESACWYSSQVAKLSVPLAYNLITFLPPPIYKSTTFYHFLGCYINLTPFGTNFDRYFPIFVLIPVFATLFGIYGKVKNLFGFGIADGDQEDEESGFSNGGWREGRDLIERELSGDSTLSRTTRSGMRSPIGTGMRSPIGGRGRGLSEVSRTVSPIVSPSTSSPRVMIPGTSSPKPVSPGASSPKPGSPGTASQSALAARLALEEASRARVAERAAARRQEDEVDEGVLGGFTHRVKNTIDTATPPQWFVSVSDGFKRPRWMGGVDGNTDTSARASYAGKFGRWFGGRPADGRVRL